MEPNHETAADPSAADVLDSLERARVVRATLPGQVFRERVEIARATYGPLYTMGQVRQLVADSLPARVGYWRVTVSEAIDSYREYIPDEALLKYDDARRSGLFSKFWVMSPRYVQQRQVDPWIIAEVRDSEHCVVIARWE